MKAIGYARVSSQEQKLGQTIQLQEKLIRERAAAEGWRLHRIYRDEALSGSNGLDTREGLAAALAALEAGQASILLISEYGRLARDLILQETTIQRLREAGVQVVAVAEPEVGGDEHTRTLVRQVLGAVKQYERAVIRARMEAGRARATAEGRRGQGAPPYGYRAGQDEKGRRGVLVPDDHEQAVLARIRLLEASGASLAEIARTLNSQGIRARRGAWHPSSVARALRRSQR